MNKLLNDAMKKLKANDQTSTLDIIPENSHSCPKKRRNSSMPQIRMIIISKRLINRTRIKIDSKFDIKLLLFLNFSETSCSKTLDIDVAIIANGMESISFERSK